MLNDFKGVLGDFLPLYFHDSNHWAPDKQIKVFSNFVTILPRYSIFKKLRGMLPIASASNRGFRLRGVHHTAETDSAVYSTSPKEADDVIFFLSAKLDKSQQKSQ